MAAIIELQFPKISMSTIQINLLTKCITDYVFSDSGVIANQLFQQLGYSDLDVITARTELDRQGMISYDS